MTSIFSGHSRPTRVCALLHTGALVLCLALACLSAPFTAWGGSVPPVLRASHVPLLPDLQYFIDETGAMDVEEVTAPANAQTFRPLVLKNLPRSTGVMWLRFTLAPLPAGMKAPSLLLDMGPSLPASPALYEPYTNRATETLEWREVLPGPRHVLTLPEAGPEARTCYMRLDGLPGIWFAPMLRTPQDAAANWSGWSGAAAMLALGVVMLLCLVRGLSEKGQWRIWTALYVAAALAQGVLGMPAYGGGTVPLNAAAAVLLPGLALMLLPHVGRHLLRTRGRSRALDAQLVLLSLPGALLALLPLFPGFGWLIRYLALWPACTLIFAPSALGGAIMGLGGARRFLLGCLIPPLFVAIGVMGLDYGYAADLLASAPLWGTALSALLMAGSGLPHDMRPKTAATGETSTAALDAALISSRMDDNPITLDQPLDDPNLRLLPPGAAARNVLPDLSGLDLPPHSSTNSPSDLAPPPDNALSHTTDSGFWENLLRPPLDRLMREGAALKHCSLPPAVRQYAENMLRAADDLSTIMDNPGKAPDQGSAGPIRSAFNLQHMVREAHDAVTTRAENAGIALAWYMPPLLEHMYEGQAQALRETLCLLLESAVRATTRGAVHLSVRRVPESADPGHLLFTVTDTGSGLPPKERSSLALTRAWELAGSNSGYLNVECGPQGASIAFTLRLSPLEAEEEASPETQTTIAVVAASAVDRQALAHTIAGLGCRSTEARSTREALQLNRESPALMLVTQFPHDGPTEADALGRFQAEALAAGLPIFKALAITADDSRWDALADCGYTHALLDPMDPQAFASTVREVLEEAALSQDSASAPEPEPAAEAAAEPVDELTGSVPHADVSAEPAGHDVLDEPASPAEERAEPAGPPADAAPQDKPSPLPNLFGPAPQTKRPVRPLVLDLSALPDILALSGKQTKTDPPPAQSTLPLPHMAPLTEPAQEAPTPDRGDLADILTRATAPDSAAAPAHEPLPAVPDAALQTTPQEGGHEAAPQPEDPAQDEFLASAGLGGPLWSDGLQEEAAAAQAPAAPEQAAPPESLPPAAPEAPLPVSTEAVPEEPRPAPLAMDNTPPQADPAPMITISARRGEATLTPVNAPVTPPTPLASPVDFVAPTGRGPSADYSLSEEWVGEPMPLGAPVAAKPPAPERPVRPQPQQATAQAADKRQYVSPSLSTPGEWVGEPMPIVKDAAQAKPADKTSVPVEARAAQRETPRTATGRLILKMLNNAGDKPPRPLPEPILNPRPISVSAQAPATPPPHGARAAAQSMGNSIINFIAGTADASRAPVPPQAPAPDTLGDTLAQKPAAAEPASLPLTPAAKAPNLPSSAQQGDQTLARLVARLDAAMEDAQQGYKNRRSPMVAEAAARIAAESDAHGFRVLARMARCVERAASANDMSALRDLLPELAVAVERNRIALTP